MNYRVIFLFLLMGFVHWTKAESIDLIAPDDDEEDVSTSPTFIWQLLPGVPECTLKYVFSIAEYDEGLGAESSMTTNLIYTDDINENEDYISYPYPGAAPDLDTCTEYIWRVRVYCVTISEEEPYEPIETLLATSDIFHFSTTCSSMEFGSVPEQTNIIYIVPQKTINNFVYLVSGDSLNFKYREHYANSSINYKIRNGAHVAVVDTSVSVQYGLNYVTIPLEAEIIDAGSFSVPKIYTLELYTPKGEILKAKFEKKEEEE